MTLRSHIENIRSKPEHVRRRIAFWTSFGFTGLLLLFWLASFSALGDVSNTAIAATVNKAGTPAQSLVASVGSFFGDVKDMIFGAKKITYSTIEVSPGN